MNFKHVTMIGLARSGVAVAKLAQEVGAHVFFSDASDSTIVKKAFNELQKYGIDGEINGHTDKIYDADLWVISPGVPKNAEIIQNAQSKDIPIVSEIEFASWFTLAPILAITGSNGKTTTAHMLYEMCKTKDIHPVLSGNVGNAFANVVRNDLTIPDEKRVHILEISSFQMEFIRHFKPYISLFLNLSPDHLNRYDDMDDYVAAKRSEERRVGKECRSRWSPYH